MQNGSKCYWIKKQIEPFHTDPTIDKKYTNDVNKRGYKIWFKWTEAYNHIRFKSKGLSALVNVWGLEISPCSFIIFLGSLNTVSLDCIKLIKFFFFKKYENTAVSLIVKRKYIQYSFIYPEVVPTGPL